MDMEGFCTHCKVRQCSNCHGGTEFYCNTCKQNLCLQCKERHVIDLDTLHHDVVIYREKYKYIPKQEACARHPSSFYNKYCRSCELPVCVECTEHRKHKMLDMRTAYNANRQKLREIIQNIRSETLYNSCSLLAGIKTDIKTCHTEISNRHSEMSTKAQKLKKLIDIFICDAENRLKYKRKMSKQQKREMSRHISSIEYYEHKSEQSANRAVKYLLFLKRTSVLKIKASPTFSQQALLFITEEMKMEDVIKLLSEIQITETGNRQARSECLLKLMSTPELHRSLTVTGVSKVRHISCVSSDRVWVSDFYNLILANKKGDTVHHLTDIASYSNMWSYGPHTVQDQITGDLIYIDTSHNIIRLLPDTRTKIPLIKITGPWQPLCIYCSPSNGDLLIGLCETDINAGIVIRYKRKRQQLQKIQYNTTGQELLKDPRYITENHNGDIIVSDLGRDAVVVTEHGGKHRFSYTGPGSKSKLWPLGICTDALSHILVCDGNTQTVQMIDKDGNFLSLILTQQQEICTPRGLCYDNKNHLLWIGSLNSNKVCIYRYIKRQGYLTGVDLNDIGGEGSQNPRKSKEGDKD